MEKNYSNNTEKNFEAMPLKRDSNRTQGYQTIIGHVSFHGAINWMVKHSMKPVTGVELLYAGLSGLLVHPPCLPTAHHSQVSTITPVQMQHLLVCLTLLSEKASQPWCKKY